jgi:hypothetical protein
MGLRHRRVDLRALPVVEQEELRNVLQKSRKSADIELKCASSIGPTRCDSSAAHEPNLLLKIRCSPEVKSSAFDDETREPTAV